MTLATAKADGHKSSGVNTIKETMSLTKEKKRLKLKNRSFIAQNLKKPIFMEQELTR